MVSDHKIRSLLDKNDAASDVIKDTQFTAFTPNFIPLGMVEIKNAAAGNTHIKERFWFCFCESINRIPNNPKPTAANTNVNTEALHQNISEVSSAVSKILSVSEMRLTVE